MRSWSLFVNIRAPEIRDLLRPLLKKRSFTAKILWPISTPILVVPDEKGLVFKAARQKIYQKFFYSNSLRFAPELDPFKLKVLCHRSHLQ